MWKNQYACFIQSVWKKIELAASIINELLACNNKKSADYINISEIEKDTFERFYNSLQEPIQNKDGKSYLDHGIKRLLIFSKMKGLSEPENELKITMNNGMANFSINGSSVYSCNVSETAISFIRDKGTNPDGTVKSRFDIRTLLLQDGNLQASKIKMIFREHSHYISKKTFPTDSDYTPATYTGSDTRYRGREYQFPADKNRKVLYVPTTPAKKAFVKGSKEPGNVDPRFFSFTPYKGERFEKMNNDDIADLSTFYPNTTVNPDLMIGRYAGATLMERTPQNYGPMQLNIDAFRKFTKDLETLHIRGIVWRDAKFENLTAMEINGENQVNAIDLDDKIKISDITSDTKEIYTDKMMTKALLAGAYSSVEEERARYLKAADNYAITICIIGCTVHHVL